MCDLIQQLHDRFTCLCARLSNLVAKDDRWVCRTGRKPSALTHGSLRGALQSLQDRNWTVTAEGKNVPLQRLSRRQREGEEWTDGRDGDSSSFQAGRDQKDASGPAAAPPTAPGARGGRGTAGCCRATWGTRPPDLGGPRPRGADAAGWTLETWTWCRLRPR